MALPLVILLGVVVVILGTFLFQFLWNATMPGVFKLPEITFWVAFRLLIIASFLTSGGFFNFYPRGQ